MKKLLFILLLTIPFVGFGQINDKWYQGFISDYNLYVDNIFNFQLKVHNSLNSNKTESEFYWEKVFEDTYSRFILKITVDGVDVISNKDPVPGSLIKLGDPRLIGGVEIDFFHKSYEEIIKSKKGISYKIKKDDFYVISGKSENISFYHKTIFKDWYLVTVNLMYNEDPFWSEEIKTKKLKLFSEMCEQIHNSLKQ